MMTNDKIKNDMTMATMLAAGLKNKSEYIVTDKYEVEIVSDGINGDIDCSNTYRDGVETGEVLRDTIESMSKLIIEVGTALDDADKEAEKKNRLNN